MSILHPLCMGHQTSGESQIMRVEAPARKSRGLTVWNQHAFASIHTHASYMCMMALTLGSRLPPIIIKDLAPAQGCSCLRHHREPTCACLERSRYPYVLQCFNQSKITATGQSSISVPLSLLWLGRARPIAWQPLFPTVVT